MRHQKALTHYWGIALMAMLFFYRNNFGALVDDIKLKFFILASIVAVILFPLKNNRYFKTGLALVLISFFNLHHLGSKVAVNQFIYICCGVILFNHALYFNKKTIVKYLGVTGAIASISILTGYLKLNYYDLVSGFYFLDFGGIPTEGVTQESQYFFGLLGQGASTAMVSILAAPFGGAIRTLLAIAASATVAWKCGSIMPFASLCSGLAVWAMLRLSNKLCVVFASLVLLIGYVSFKKLPDSEIEQVKPRLEIFQAAFNKALERPFIGHGPGYFFDASYADHMKGKREGVYVPHYGNVHNDFIEIFFSHGLFGLMILFYLLIKSLQNKDQKNLTSLASLLILALTWFPLSIVIVSQIAIIIFAMSQTKGETSCGLS